MQRLTTIKCHGYINVRKVLFKGRSINGDKETHFIMINGSIQKEDNIPHSIK